MSESSIEKIISLAKRRGFVFPGSDIYGGLANSWDFGPLGVELKRNIKDFWWKRFVRERDDVVGIDGAIIMNPRVWEASGHLKEFSDPLIECKNCHHRFRPDAIPGVTVAKSRRSLDDSKPVLIIGSGVKCPHCGEDGGKYFDGQDVRQFNLMLKTFLGPVEDAASTVYLRPETAQAMFVDFKNVLDTTRKRLPFGIAQIGKSFRNEITPGNFIFRTREFEIMEIEYFVRESEWEERFEHWRKEMLNWMQAIGINPANVHEEEIPDGERAHYSKRTIDFEYDFPFGKKELYGLAYRGDFDLQNHQRASGVDLSYRDPQTGEQFVPHVIEPTWGVERTVLAVLADAYDDSEEGRVVLKLKPHLAPYKAAVFPLLANKPQLVELAKTIYDTLRKTMSVAFDDRGNIGKRYYSQDEIGTPACITVDFESLENATVTLRHRDTAKQERVPINEVALRIGEIVV